MPATGHGRACASASDGSSPVHKSVGHLLEAGGAGKGRGIVAAESHGVIADLGECRLDLELEHERTARPARSTPPSQCIDLRCIEQAVATIGRVEPTHHTPTT